MQDNQKHNTAASTAPPESGSDKSENKMSRRKFFATSAAGAAAAGFPMVSFAQTTTFNFQSTWPSRDIFHEFASDFVRVVNEMSGGRLRINLLPSGAVVGALQMQDAVIAGALDGGHGLGGAG